MIGFGSGLINVTDAVKVPGKSGMKKMHYALLILKTCVCLCVYAYMRGCLLSLVLN